MRHLPRVSVLMVSLALRAPRRRVFAHSAPRRSSAPAGAGEREAKMRMHSVHSVNAAPRLCVPLRSHPPSFTPHCVLSLQPFDRRASEAVAKFRDWMLSRAHDDNCFQENVCFGSCSCLMPSWICGCRGSDAAVTRLYALLVVTSHRALHDHERDARGHGTKAPASDFQPSASPTLAMTRRWTRLSFEATMSSVRPPEG